ncbi:MAG: MotA/TolQ/ExbB proton channel family protein, partial [Alistipes sp.]|nr:MotA/TolQ/ExbB proton channel family protein [Alistipes sp.]
MKKLFLILTVALFSLGTVNAFAQEAEAAAATEAVEAVAEEAAAVEAVDAETEIAGESMHHVLMQKFLEGGWGWMLPVLLCLVL